MVSRRQGMSEQLLVFLIVFMCRRIGEYVSLELFYSVSKTDRKCLIKDVIIMMSRGQHKQGLKWM